MFAIALIRAAGGYRTVTGNDLIECKKYANDLSHRFEGAYLCATVPYPIVISDKTGYFYSAEIPFEIKKNLGLEIRLTLNGKLENYAG